MGRDRTRLERLENLQNVFGPVTPTLNYIVVADGTTFNSVALSGDATIISTGAMTVSRIGGWPFTSSIPSVSNIFVANGLSWDSVPVTGDIAIDPTGIVTVTQILGNVLSDTTVDDGSLLVGRLGVGWFSRLMSGDGTLDNSGALTIDPRFVSDATSAGGDLTGTYPSPTIVSSVSLSGSPLTSTPPALNNSFRIANTTFVNAEIAAIGQYFAPATGATVSPTAPQMIMNVFINPAAGIATLTLTLPTGTLQGQMMHVAFTQVVTALTVTATNIGTHGIASPTTAIATSSFAWAWDNTAAKWNRFL